MDVKRIVLYLALAFVGMTLWNEWSQTQRQAQKKTAAVSQQKAAGTTQLTAPSMAASAALSPQQKEPQKVPHGRIIHVKTDVLNIAIDSQGGNLVSAKLPKYPVSIQEKNTPVQLFNDKVEKFYVAESGFINENSKKISAINYSSAKSNYQLADGQDVLQVVLTGKGANGLLFSKTYTFTRKSYAIGLSYKIVNKGSKPWAGSFYTQIRRRNVKGHGILHTRSYTGVAISSAAHPYEQLSFKKLNEETLDRNIHGGWLAMQQHYFLSAWIPPQNTMNHYYSHISHLDTVSETENIYTVGITVPAFSVAAGATKTGTTKLYVGPEITKKLAKLAHGLDLTIDYGMLWWLSKPIFWTMAKIHGVVGNWGWAIIFVTILIKLLFYPLSAKSYFSMAKMRAFAPQINALKERLGDDRAKLSQATMELYRKHKINPLGGCLPMVIQVPFFIALYYVLIESVQLRQAPFIFWIHDLSVFDPFYVLPILMGLSMFLQQRISPPPSDAAQAKMMMFMPLIFTFFFLHFPAGLVLYWLTNNCVSILQQWYVMRHFSAQKK